MLSLQKHPQKLKIPATEAPYLFYFFYQSKSASFGVHPLIMKILRLLPEYKNHMCGVTLRMAAAIRREKATNLFANYITSYLAINSHPAAGSRCYDSARGLHDPVTSGAS